MKRKLFLLLCALLTMIGVQAQVDVTDTYITNPSFDLGTDGTPKSTGKSFVAPYSWTPTNLPTSGTHNFSILSASETGDTSPSNFGTTVTPSNGDYYYLARHSWSTSLTTILTQTSKTTLPVGKYLLTIDYKIAKSDGNLTPNGYLTLQAKQGESSLGSNNSAISASQNSTYFNTAAWSTILVPFEVTSEGNVDFIITFNFNPTSANIPQEAIIIDNVRLNKNNVQPVANNTTDLYFKNEQTGQFLSAGHSWGTHATVDNYGLEITATLSNGVYKLKSQQHNAYVGGLYMDSGDANQWAFLETSSGSGKYYMTQDGTHYMTSNGAGAELVNVTTPTEASVWTIVSKTDRKSALSSATIDNPGNATFLIGDANFSRNCLQTPWTMEANNKNLSGGANDNMCAESYHAVFTLSQTLSSMPVGVYGLTAQGFYRQDGSDNENLPNFYISDQKGTFPARTGNEGSMSDASVSFTAGLYTIQPIYYRLDTEGSITLGAKLETNTSLWCIFDNFQLKYYGDVTVAEVKLKAFVDAYNDAMNEAKAFTEGSMFADAWTTLQGVITANTLDLNDPSLTESDLTTATNNLVAANSAATAAVAAKTTYDAAVSLINSGTNVDLTSLITNPGFETGNTNGWTNSGSITANAQSNDAFDNKKGTWYAERWHVSGTVDINQTLQYLPAGIYSIEAYMFSDTGDAKLYANSENVSVSTSGKYTTVIEIADKGSIKIGASCTLTNSTWICLDDFKLIFVGTVDDLTYTLATGKMDPAKAAAQTAAETAFLANKNLTTYNALLAAIAEAEASVANYAKLKAAIDKANDVREKNNFVTTAASTVFQAEIDEATNGWTNVTYSDAECNEETVALGTTVSGWHGNATGAAGIYMASTWGKTNENWWEAPYINTWSTEGDNDGTGFSVPFFEWFVDNTQNLPLNTTLSATLEGLENGCYEVELWGRAQRRTDANFGNANEITMSVNDGDAVSIMNGTTIVNGGQNNEMRLGHFTARGMVTNGTLTLSIKTGGNGSNVHWLCWRDVKYTKLDEANMAVNAEAQWGTFCAPFAVAIPDGVTAYTCADATKGVLNLEEVTPTIPANTPVILNAESGLASTTFYGVKVANESEDLIADGLLRGNVSNSAKDIAYTGNEYLLQRKNDKTGFYKMNNENTYKVGYNRCYLVMDSNQGGNAREVFFFEDDATAISALEAAKAETGALKDGKYLIGNKVVIVKNGVKYGASGQKLN